jgi:hypothetical protein
MAQWRKVVVSGSNAVLNEVTASGAIVPKTDDTVDLGSSALEFKDLYIDGTAYLDSATITAGTITGITDLTVADGGTGVSTLTDGGVLLGNGAGDIQAMAVLTDGQFIVGDGTTDPVAESGDTARISMGVGSTSTWQITGLDVGHATDTTVTRVSAGDLNIEGNIIYRAGGTDVPVSDGGTGVSTLTDGGILLGSGTGAITATAVLADGEILIGDGTTDPVALDVGGNGGITILGTIATGVWQGTAVADTYVANDLTISGGTVNNSVIGGTTAAAITGTTITGTAISGSSVSSSGAVVAAGGFYGDGSNITNLTAAAISSYTNTGNNRIMTSVDSSTANSEANLTFDGTDVVVAGGGKVAFRDNGGEYIYSVSDNVLGLAAGSEIDLTATTIDINGLVDISGNLTVGGDLDVNGTTTTINTANSYITDKFMIMASGSTSDTDGGIIVQNAAGSGYALGYDSGVDRWAFDADLAHNATALGPDAYVGVVQVATTDGDSLADPIYGGGVNGVGTIYVDTDDSEIWIYA